VAIAASDGAALAASYFPAAQRGPAMLLLHQCDMTRASWTPLATALAASGINVLAPDYRGYGGNRALGADYPKRGADADAALDWLLKQPTVDPRGVAVGGASCGVDHAVQLARRKDDVRALLLLSGGASSTGMTFLRAARIPVLLAYSVEEGGPLPAAGGRHRLVTPEFSRQRALACRSRRAHVRQRSNAAPVRCGLGREGSALTVDRDAPGECFSRGGSLAGDQKIKRSPDLLISCLHHARRRSEDQEIS
jgi:pimeloyl-ACP methyl ester carboxylesterase